MGEVPISRQAVITFAEQCDQGKVREENQDCVRHVRFALGELFIVADGMGGYSGGATASRMVVDGFHEYLASLPQDYSLAQAIREASARVNESIVTAANAPNSPYRKMGSTVVLALIQQDATGTQAWIGHVGDSRAYLARAGELSLITRDHSAVQALLSRNLITPEEALHHPDASVLTRCLGHKGEVEIDIDIVSLEPGDSLLLCSDGLWGFVSEPEIQLVAANAELSVEAAAQALLDLALAAGGQDNIGIEMVRLNLSAAAAAPQSGKRRHIGLMEILALCLLVIAGLGASAYFGMQSQWAKNLRHPHSTPASPTPAPTAVIPETPGVSPTPLVKPKQHEQKKAVTPGTPPGPVPANNKNNGRKNTVSTENHGTPPATDTRHQDSAKPPVDPPAGKTPPSGPATKQ